MRGWPETAAKAGDGDKPGAADLRLPPDRPVVAPMRG